MYMDTTLDQPVVSDPLYPCGEHVRYPDPQGICAPGS